MKYKTTPFSARKHPVEHQLQPHLLPFIKRQVHIEANVFLWPTNTHSTSCAHPSR